MTVRDTHKDEAYFRAWLKNKKKLFRQREEAIEKGKVAESRLPDIYYLYTRDHISQLIGYYSMGFSKEELRDEMIPVIDLMTQYWIPDRTKMKLRVKGKMEILDEYWLESYEFFLKILSLAYLLEISDDYFQKLVAILDRDNISDKLYECIIQARIPERVKEKTKVFKPYKRLCEACDEPDKTKASELVKVFLEKDFYHKHMVLYDTHKLEGKLYRGYWSFEAAAVVKAKSLDDASFRDHPYYPADLV